MRQYCLKAEVICSDEGKSLVNAFHNSHCIPLVRADTSHGLTHNREWTSGMAHQHAAEQPILSFFLNLIFCSLNGVTTLAVKGEKKVIFV